MTKSRRRIKHRDNPSRSERSKYLETMMADMGLISLDELSSNEERNRWLKAARPSPEVEEKLIEMGYSITGNSNKRSLGSRKGCLKLFRKIAGYMESSNEFTFALRDLREVVSEDASYEIIKQVNVHEYLTAENFDSNHLKTTLSLIVERHMGETASYLYYIQNLVDKATKYNSDYLSDLSQTQAAGTGDAPAQATGTGSTGSGSYVEEDVEFFFRNNSNISIGRNHSSSEQVRFIQRRLEGLGYTLSQLGANGIYDENTEDAVILFQQHNNLTPSGTMDGASIDKLLTNPVRMQRDSRRVHRRRLRSERDTAPADQDGTGADNPSFQNIKYTSSRVDIAGASSMLREYIALLNQAAENVGGEISITSAFRDSYNQSRIMYSNYKRRGVGSRRANSYLSSLYRRLPGTSEIVEIFSGSSPDDQKIREAEAVIETKWPKSGHRAGYSIDVRFGNKVKEILEESQDMATVDILRESDHFHVTVKSLTPGGIPRGTMRRFNS